MENQCRNRLVQRALLALVIVLVLLFVGCDKKAEAEKKTPKDNTRLKQHSQEFKKEIIEVLDGVYVAIGYGLANSIMIEGDDGVIIIDCMESTDAAKPIREAFRSITDKPVKAIIYTHNHTDHVMGASAMAGDDSPTVIAHDSTSGYIDNIVAIIRPIIFKRSMRMFGVYLKEGDLLNAGIGPFLYNNDKTIVSILRPDQTFKDRMEIEIAGVKLNLFFAPGETPDQIFVWLDDKKALFSGDNFYKAFPNLYTIRGTAYRDVMQWVESIDLIRSKKAHYLIPSHSKPLVGKEIIHQTLTDYRDAIQFVHDQTVRGMNKGFTPDELVEFVQLPPHLSKSPYLQEYYGTVEWSVRSIFSGYLGWFSGNATDLSKLSTKEKAKRLSRLAGGESVLLDQLKKAVMDNDDQWALELADHLLALDFEVGDVRSLKAEALESLGRQHISANGRNYYLSQAAELRDELDLDNKKPIAPMDVVHQVPLGAVFRSMAVNLIPEKSVDVEKSVTFNFPDVDEDYSILVRKGVAEIRNSALPSADITVSLNSNLWKEIAGGYTSPVSAYAKGDIDIEGGALSLARFLTMFKE